MSRNLIFDKINYILENAGYPYKVNTLSELRAFLNNDGNRELRVYDKINELYDTLILVQGMW